MCQRKVQLHGGWLASKFSAMGEPQTLTLGYKQIKNTMPAESIINPALHC